MSQQQGVQARFFQPPPELRRYFTTFYLMELPAADSAPVADFLHPEWANLRFFDSPGPNARTQNGTMLRDAIFYATGPSSNSLHFEMAPPQRMWGVGFLPLGWAKFVHTDAGELADALVDGHVHPAFADFRPLADSIFAERADPAMELVRLTNFFLDRADLPIVDEDRIIAIHTALIDPEVRTVTQLVDHAGISQRTLERICHRAFGFAPKLLLRRQRFLRSLSHYVLDPSLKWIGALDSQYHDQAQFVRDFRQFMGMTPRQYAALPKPILGAFMVERSRLAMQPVQGLDGPEGGSPP